MIIWIAILAGLLVFYILGLTVVPAAWKEIDGVDLCPSDIADVKQFCRKLILTEKNNWEGHIFGVTNYNQFLVLEVSPIKNYFKIKDKFYQFSALFNVSISEIDNYGIPTDSVISNKLHSLEFTCPIDTSATLCNERNLFLMPEIKYGNYRITIEIENASDYIDSIEGLYFTAYVVSKEFTQFVLGIRYSFLILSIFCLGIYLWSYLKLPKNIRIFEQKFCLLLGVSLVFFNDPLTALSILNPNGIWLYFSVTFYTFFAAMIHYYWLVMFERIWKENDKRECKTKQAWKLILSALIFVFYEVAGCMIFYMYWNDPSFSPGDDYPSAFIGFVITGISLTGLVYCYLIYSGVMVYTSWKNRLQRHKTFFLFS